MTASPHHRARSSGHTSQHCLHQREPCPHAHAHTCFSPPIHSTPGSTIPRCKSLSRRYRYAQTRIYAQRRSRLTSAIITLAATREECAFRPGSTIPPRQYWHASAQSRLTWISEHWHTSGQHFGSCAVRIVLPGSSIVPETSVPARAYRYAPTASTTRACGHADTRNQTRYADC
eukprot:675549-Rhodomonas_salina.3